jgi:NAD(P)-dependent dehydrogenase (short-subunit alcohol dehydrogenase family)
MERKIMAEPQERSGQPGDDIGFAGQVAIVTGAGGGLGREYALELARRGASVVVNDLGGLGSGADASPEPADAVVAEIRDAGGTAVASHASVATRAGGESIVRTALDHFGRVDALICNAGYLHTGRFEELPDERIDSMIDVHLKAAFHVGQPAFRAMKRQRYGRLLFTASASGFFGHPGQASYGAAKAGLLGLSNVLALEGEAFGVQSNLLLPAAYTRLATSQDWTWLADYPGFARMLEEMEGAPVSERIAPSWVTPLAVYLVSRQCRATHGAYSAVGGRYARVFIGATHGWRSAELPSVEALAAAWETVEDRADFGEPLSVYHEVMDINRSWAGEAP